MEINYSVDNNIAKYSKIIKEDDEKISWAADGYGLEFEYRYQNEKNPEKRKKEVKKFIEELDFEDR